MAIMADGEQKLVLKFRIYDGTDICHGTYAPSATVATLKQILVAEWPQDKATIPKSVNGVKLIHAGRFLENSETLADSQMTFSNLPGEVNTMHVVAQPAISKKKNRQTGGGAKVEVIFVYHPLIQGSARLHGLWLALKIDHIFSPLSSFRLYFPSNLQGKYNFMQHLS